MFNVSGESLIYSYFVKYDRLKDLILTHYVNSDAEHLDIYIDIYSILKSISRYNHNQITYNDSMFLASGIVNMCTHYREYFKTRHGVTTRFFLINSTVDDSVNNSCRLFYKDYDKKYGNGYNGKMEELFSKNMTSLKTLYPFLPNIYYIELPFEFRDAVLDIRNYELRNSNIQYPTLLITKDLFNITILSIDPTIKILRPHKDNKLGCDDSYIIDCFNWSSILFSERKVEYVPNNIFCGLIPMVLALSRCPERNIKRMYNLDVVMKRLNEMKDYNLNILMYYTSDMETFCNEFIRTMKTKKNPIEIINRFKVIHCYPYSSMNIELWYKKIDLEDMNALKELNETLFKNCPLDIQSL